MKTIEDRQKIELVKQQQKNKEKANFLGTSSEDAKLTSEDKRSSV